MNRKQFLPHGGPESSLLEQSDFSMNMKVKRVARVRRLSRENARSRPSFARALLVRMLGSVVLLSFCGCSTEHYKAEADKEVYQIIDRKWQGSFGHKSNYIISDSNVPPSPNDIHVEKVVPESGVLSLAQAVAIATRHNREYQRQKEQLYLAALDLSLARHQFARQWFGTVDAGYARDSSDESVGSSAEVGFDQLLADGARVSTSIAIDWARFLTGDPRTSLGSVLSASVTQPLLRGSGRKIAQENLTQAERNALYEIRSFSRYRKIFVVSIVTYYYRVLQQRDAVANAKNNYESKVELRERLQMEANEGVTPRFQVDQAEQSELLAQDSYVRAQQRYEQLLDAFKIALSLPTDATIELDQDELRALEETGIVEFDYELEAAIEAALAQRLDLANSADALEDAARKVAVAADNLGAELNLVGSAGVQSTPETDIKRLQLHRGAYALGLEADLPLDRKAERNAYREALIALEQQERKYENDVDEVKLDVRNAYRKLREEAESYRTQKKALQLAKVRVGVSPILWEAGRMNARDYLESQDAYLSAQNDVMAALVSHAIAKLNFFRDVGLLQVRPDGMWEEQAQ
ncbi:MAG: TolC family protein [Phycisphaerales bacterium]|nr:MAG: TolC family protein [Phycisphaerales bacterium]